MPIDMARLSKPVAAQSAPPSVILVVQIFFSSLLAEPTGIEPASPTRQAGMLPLHHGSVWWSVLESDQVGPEDNGSTIRPRAVRVYRSAGGTAGIRTRTPWVQATDAPVTPRPRSACE